LSLDVTLYNSISLVLTVSSILIGASSFLLGFYLSEWKKGVPKEKLKPFKILLLSLLLPIFLLSASSISVAIPNFTHTSFEYFLMLTIFLSLIPPIAFTIVLLKYW